MGGKWSAFWAKHDADDLFAYDTFKMVTIRDRYLGILHHVLQIGIVLYIIVYVLIVQKEFLNREPAIGLVRLAVQNQRGAAGNGSYTPRSYCSNPSSPNPSLPRCVYPPLNQISDSTGSVLFLTTHMNVTDYYSDCDVTELNCDPIAVNGTKELVVANMDDITISIDHSAQVDFDNKAPLGYLQTLKNPNADNIAWKSCKDCSVQKFKSLAADYLKLSDLLIAAHLNMEDIANEYLMQTDEYTGPQSYRNFGAVILLSVVYDNVENYFSGNPPILYHYRPQLITDVDDYAVDSYYTSYPNNRTLVHRKGIRIVGLMAGEIGAFTFQALLIQLTTSIALVKVATTAVDLLAIHLLPRKVLYKNAKFEKTDDFGDLKKSKIELQSSSSIGSEADEYAKSNV